MMSNLFISTRIQRANAARSNGYYLKAVQLLEDIPYADRFVCEQNIVVCDILAYCYGRLGYYEKSIFYAEQLLLILSDNPKHPDTISAYICLGYAKMQLGDYISSDEFYVRALSMSLALYGSEHLFNISIYECLGYNFMYQHKWDMSMKYFKKCVDFYVDHIGEDHFICVYYKVLYAFCQFECNHNLSSDVPDISSFLKQLSDFIQKEVSACLPFKYQKFLGMCRLFLYLTDNSSVSSEDIEKMFDFYRCLKGGTPGFYNDVLAGI